MRKTYNESVDVADEEHQTDDDLVLKQRKKSVLVVNEHIRRLVNSSYKLN